MTEKDFFKFPEIKNNKIKYLKVSLQIKDQEKILKRINKLHDKIN